MTVLPRPTTDPPPKAASTYRKSPGRSSHFVIDLPTPTRRQMHALCRTGM